jgi:serine-type D-Ala-D-Ala carboxypeptidase (penicillin-binding protein 5/6)
MGRGLSLLSVVATLTSFLVASPAGAQAPVPPVIDATAYVLVDAATGAVLVERGLHQPLLVASTVKAMTALTAIRHLGLNSTISVSQLAASREPYRIGMVAGQTWPMLESLYCLVLASANDVAYAMAETAGGSLRGFADQMTAVGNELGMRDSTFLDPAGFDDESAEIGPSRMSVFDLAVAGRAALAHPTLRTIVGTTNYAFVDPTGAERTLTNHARMLRPTSPQYYEGTNGVKTGFTDAASGTYIASATRNGRTLIAVQLGQVAIYDAVRPLLDFGFANPDFAGTGETLPAVPTWVSAAETLVTPTTEVAAATTVLTTIAESSTSQDDGGGFVSMAMVAFIAAAGLLGAWILYAQLVVVPRKRARARARRRAQEAMAVPRRM